MGRSPGTMQGATAEQGPASAAEPEGKARGARVGTPLLCYGLAMFCVLREDYAKGSIASSLSGVMTELAWK